jgi:hypothetical protein
VYVPDVQCVCIKKIFLSFHWNSVHRFSGSGFYLKICVSTADFPLIGIISIVLGSLVLIPSISVYISDSVLIGR